MKKKEHMNLHQLLIQKLQALYDVENALIKALPKMAKAATDPDLKETFREHLDETRVHARRLEEAFSSLDEKPKKLKSEAIRGIIADAGWVMKNVKGKEALDANIIAAAQYAEHYEIAGYAAALEWAKLMEHSETVDLLGQTLAEERAADKKLMHIATLKVNERADMD